MSIPRLILALALSGWMAAQTPTRPAAILQGPWHGALALGVSQLRLVFDLETQGALHATLQSPDQGTARLPSSAATWDGTTLVLRFDHISGILSVVLDASGSHLQGTWQQGGQTLPLTLERGSGSIALIEPHPPFPYRQVNLLIANSKAKVQLAGTLTVPPGRGPFPAVVLIPGSGPADRDGTVFGHHPSLVLADALTRRGIAVLRFDKRGIGKSTGDFGTATIADFADDVEAALDHLKAQPEIDPRHLGLIGHSEGGMIAPLVATRRHDIAFVVLLAGPGEKGDALLLSQAKAMNVAAGVSPAGQEANARVQRAVFAIIRSVQTQAQLQARIEQEESAGRLPPVPWQRLVLGSLPWFRSFLDFDPQTYLRQLKCPVLALIGSRDLQVPASENLPLIRTALQQAGNHDFQVTELPNLNHLFQSATTGLPNEYAQIAETIAPAALQLIGDWITAHTRQAAG